MLSAESSIDQEFQWFQFENKALPSPPRLETKTESPSPLDPNGSAGTLSYETNPSRSYLIGVRRLLPILIAAFISRAVSLALFNPRGPRFRPPWTLFAPLFVLETTTKTFGKALVDQ